MSIGARIQECVDKLHAEDAENAFIQLAIAIDGTAKKLYPGITTTERCKRFLRENLSFVFWVITSGVPNKVRGFSLEVRGSDGACETIGFEDLVYKVMRCSLLHEGVLSEKVEFINIPCISTLNGKIQFPLALVGALLFAVIASSASKGQKVSEKSSLLFGETRVSVIDMLGSMEKTKSAIRHGFLYDFEQLLED